MGHTTDETATQSVQVVNATGASSVVLVCEHASHTIPEPYAHLGLSLADRTSHAAWDPGALGVAMRMSERFDAVLLAGTVSRLVYDLNRPPQVPGAMPAQSEVVVVPGNTGLTQAERDARTERYYVPFHDRLAQTMADTPTPVLVTVHSFTPIYNGQRRSVEIGVLHDTDSRLADAMLACAAAHTDADVQRNAPYGPQDGVTHTLQRHGVAQGHPNVMLEVRNDLIATAQSQADTGEMIAAWVAEACTRLGSAGRIACVA